MLPLQFEPFIWSTMRQRQTPTCRSGMWPSWSWVVTGAIWTDLSSCVFGKPSTGLSPSLCIFIYVSVLLNSYLETTNSPFFPSVSRLPDTWWNTNLTSGSEPRSQRPSPTFQLSSAHLLQRLPLLSKLPSHLPTWSPLKQDKENELSSGLPPTLSLRTP